MTTVCDTNSYLWGIGKGTVFKHLKGGYQLKMLGADLQDVISEATSFFAVCLWLKGERRHNRNTI